METKWIAIMVLGVFAALAISSFAPSEKENARQAKWNNCVDSVNKAIPDSNDTDKRADLLKSCYENNN